MLGYNFVEGVQILKDYLDDTTSPQVFIVDSSLVFEVAWEDLTWEDHEKLANLGFSQIKTDDGYMVGFQD